jgi:hypothetical protein
MVEMTTFFVIAIIAILYNLCKGKPVVRSFEPVSGPVQNKPQVELEPLESMDYMAMGAITWNELDSDDVPDLR